LWVALETEPADPAYQAALRRFGTETVIERHDKLEAMLETTDYLLGDRPTLADAVLVGVARWLEYHRVAAPERWPRLLNIRKHIERDPAVRFALAVENGGRPAGCCRGHVELAEVIERFGRTIRRADAAT
jgi:glutathione S-transferase